MTDITIVTAKQYLTLSEENEYTANIAKEYYLLKNALEEKGFTVARTHWDNPDYDWSKTKVAVIRTVWDYFEKFEAFSKWMKVAATKTKLINPLALQQWNSHKFYLSNLEKKGVRIVPTEFVNKGATQTLREISEKRDWQKMVIKPAISAAAFHTYVVSKEDFEDKEQLFNELLQTRDMLVQEFQETITTMGEASLMVFGGKFTHAILKKAKEGDFRVQDDFGGTVHPYTPTDNEIKFAEFANAQCPVNPIYGRVDIIWDNEGLCYLSEMEFLDPEIWLRNAKESATVLAEAISKELN
ncbi:ATP-grasp domain-containing protein [Patiriisocius hiemis]|uniref:ATP-grasp fold RimK-type domain-containing protein n=1 Tax=Patiriisocius hiemis TaxID=3075604 RepID=A0ABU2YF14_9FLAO|nr:hypothetical protein [Constantimarinum sp. W242]MDT0556337.1 hypothetical protein [Constantimarinum sp. W242]